MTGLPYPLPRGAKVVRRTATLMVIQLALPLPVAQQLSELLEYAGRMTGSDKLGGQIDAIAAECLSEWRNQV